MNTKTLWIAVIGLGAGIAAIVMINTPSKDRVPNTTSVTSQNVEAVFASPPGVEPTADQLRQTHMIRSKYLPQLYSITSQLNDSSGSDAERLARRKFVEERLKQTIFEAKRAMDTLWTPEQIQAAASATRK